MNTEQNILLAFYGDDLTGSTDALEFICRAGAHAVLFLEPPSLAHLHNYPGLQAYGVAGLTRSLSPEMMEKVLTPSLKTMKESGARHIHYKVCSTFDSSPHTGSIGRAIDCGAAIFQHPFVPVLGGMPALGRYCVFGNLFARMGTSSSGNIYRLDRHPSMSRHPVTPAHESDLRIHLGNQTKRKIGLIDVIQIEKDIAQWHKAIKHDDEVVLLDALEEAQLLKIGAWLDAQCKNGEPLYSVGSSGIEMALGQQWNKMGMLQPTQSWRKLDKAEPLLVVSGSCSPVTKNQIAYALANGFAEVPVVADCSRGGADDAIVFCFDLKKLTSCLTDKQSVIVHTGNLGDVPHSALSESLGPALGSIASNAIRAHKLKRVVIAGGDTSSEVGRVLDIEALEMIAPLVAGAPVCKAHSSDQAIDGMEINFKGGQVGSEDYFVILRDGNKKTK
ncbi:MAG TPA: four-carbon acid sugar kinase family protein [Flavisolibacter sp.]|nr:four-carbon acid sugar kinase family protein [Flavisolibacter sp.]